MRYRRNMVQVWAVRLCNLTKRTGHANRSTQAQAETKKYNNNGKKEWRNELEGRRRRRSERFWAHAKRAWERFNVKVNYRLCSCECRRESCIACLLLNKAKEEEKNHWKYIVNGAHCVRFKVVARVTQQHKFKKKKKQEKKTVVCAATGILSLCVFTILSKWLSFTIYRTTFASSSL